MKSDDAVERIFSQLRKLKPTLRPPARPAISPCFESDRLHVFKLECSRGPEFVDVDCYLAFEAYPLLSGGVPWPVLTCTLEPASESVAYIECNEQRKGYALEFLLALSRHLKRTTPLTGQSYTPDGERLFTRYRTAFNAESGG